jgi:hypothetical protein
VSFECEGDCQNGKGTLKFQRGFQANFTDMIRSSPRNSNQESSPADLDEPVVSPELATVAEKK